MRILLDELLDEDPRVPSVLDVDATTLRAVAPRAHAARGSTALGTFEAADEIAEPVRPLVPGPVVAGLLVTLGLSLLALASAIAFS